MSHIRHFIHYYKHVGSRFNTKPCVELLCKHLSSVYSTQCTTNSLLQYAISNNYTCRVIHYFNTTSAKLKVTLLFNGSSKFCIYYAHI